MGVDVEVEPFGTLNPFSRLSPRATTGAYGEGANVEFELPEGAIPEPDIRPRNNMRIPTTTPLSLIGLKPVFVRAGGRSGSGGIGSGGSGTGEPMAIRISKQEALRFF